MSTPDSIARVCHEANRAYCISLGDDSQRTWGDAAAWQRESAVSGVCFHLAHPDSVPEDSHVNWMREKVEAGWVWGEAKDAEAKTHPCMVPYGELPEPQRRKDALFIAVVRALAP